MKMAIAESLSKSYSYQKYRSIVTQLLSDGKSSGNVQSDDLWNYSRLNESRMNRLDKRIEVPEELALRLLSLKNKYVWLVLSEGWCGDAAQLLPIFNKLAIISTNLELKIAFRDENEPLMQAFLTNGSRSIPKLIVLDADSHEVRASWGPRPKGASDFIASYKSQYGVIDETARTELHLWYTNDKGISTQTELIGLMEDLDAALYTKR